MSEFSEYMRLLPYGYAPGNYMSKCFACEKVVADVDKRATSCRPCAETAFKDHEIERLRAEAAGVREALAQKVVDQTMLTGLTVQDGGLTMGLQGGAAGLLAEMLTQQFKDGGGINYLQLSFTSSVALPGEAFIVTVQKCSGKTPHQLRMEAEAEAAGLREDAERWRSLVANSSYLDYPANDMGALISPPFRRWYHDSVYETPTFADAIDAARKGEA